MKSDAWSPGLYTELLYKILIRTSVLGLHTHDQLVPHWTLFTGNGTCALNYFFQVRTGGTKHRKSCNFNNMPTPNLNDLTFKIHAKQKELFSLHSKQSTSEI